MDPSFSRLRVSQGQAAVEVCSASAWEPAVGGDSPLEARPNMRLHNRSSQKDLSQDLLERLPKSRSDAQRLICGPRASACERIPSFEILRDSIQNILDQNRDRILNFARCCATEQDMPHTSEEALFHQELCEPLSLGVGHILREVGLPVYLVGGRDHAYLGMQRIPGDPESEIVIDPTYRQFFATRHAKDDPVGFFEGMPETLIVERACLHERLRSFPHKPTRKFRKRTTYGARLRSATDLKGLISRVKGRPAEIVDAYAVLGGADPSKFRPCWHYEAYFDGRGNQWWQYGAHLRKNSERVAVPALRKSLSQCFRNQGGVLATPQKVEEDFEATEVSFSPIPSSTKMFANMLELEKLCGFVGYQRPSWLTNAALGIALERFLIEHRADLKKTPKQNLWFAWDEEVAVALPNSYRVIPLEDYLSADEIL